MTNPTELNAFSTLPAEAQQHILRYVGNPAVTSRVSRAWQAQTQAAVNSELLQVFQYLNPGQPFNPAVDLSAITEIYRQTLQLAPANTAPHLPHLSFERFLEAEKAIKIRDTLTLWSRLPGGQDYIGRQNFDGSSLEGIREHLQSWIEQNPDARAITRLILNNSNLRYLPPEIGQLTHLQMLNLSENQLTELPPEIGLLTNLQTLYLIRNQLTELPPEIGLLTNLQMLNLYRNQLTALSREIGQLRNLQKLILSENQLTELPSEIGQLTNLQELYLTQNQLTELPPAIGLLTNLQQLHLYRNQLTELPETLEYSRLQISLSQGGNCGNVVYNFVSAATAYRFFQLNAEQKNAVYGGIYHLAINAGENIESWDSQYGEYHVFDHEERLVAAMSEL